MIRGLVATLLLLAWTQPAAADPDAGDRVIRDADRYFQLTVPADWRPLSPAPGPPAEELLHAFAQGDRVLTVTRIDYPNPRRKDRRFHDQVEAGVRAASDGYKRHRRRFSRVRHVVVMDLELSRNAGDGREHVTIRFLFFRTFTLILTVTDSRRSRANRALARGFQPYFAD